MDEKLSDERATEILLANAEPDNLRGVALRMGAAAIAAQKELVDALQAVMKQIVPHPRAVDLEDSSIALQRAFALMLKYDRLNKSESGFWWIAP